MTKPTNEEKCEHFKDGACRIASVFNPTPSPEARVDWEKSCGVCGGKMALIRGRYPHTDKRSVCPTCLCERMEQIREIADDNYGKAGTTAAYEAGVKSNKGEMK